MNGDQRAVRFHGGDKDSGGVFAVETRVPAGLCLEAHKHTHGHMSVLAQGVADVTIDGKTERMTGPCVVLVPANIQHAVVSVTDIVWYCLWADEFIDKSLAAESVQVVEAGIAGLSHV